MHPLQAMVNGMNSYDQTIRAQSQMTLGGLIAALKKLPPDAKIERLERPHSYRGYYCDLAFERPPARKIKVSVALKMCQGVMGKVFEGYKGGDYTMGESTPIWSAYFGDCGKKIIGLEDGVFILQDDD